ncbi:MAG TPA: cellulose synthase complex periplasmic endoglucanase BcsZ [Solimonas sp.]|nr:cellulose synthase complex periplasmic endoglucanase BcsZ [Solimonas sp.]
MRFKTFGCLALALAATLAMSCARAKDGWPAWNDYATRFVQADGRVVDLTFEQKSTSEGQSYGMFFALVANDRPRFDAILKWTSDNLAGGRLGEKLPAWHWGVDEHGKWGVRDPNPASDADLFIAYDLLEAARLWHEPRYAETGRKLLAQVVAREVVEAGATGTLLLPGPEGFVLENGRFRVDPSYLPGFQLHYFAQVDPKGPWQKIWDSYMRLAPQIFAAGVAPDLFVVDSAGKVHPDTDRERGGAYDAIRVYAWAAMSPRDGPALLKLLRPFAELIRARGAPPERLDPITGKPAPGDYSPVGFSGAVLPYLRALGEEKLLEKQREHIRWARLKNKVRSNSNYYDDSLVLFGEGWLEGWYRFDDNGRLVLKWAG